MYPPTAVPASVATHLSRQDAGVNMCFYRPSRENDGRRVTALARRSARTERALGAAHSPVIYRQAREGREVVLCPEVEDLICAERGRGRPRRRFVAAPRTACDLYIAAAFLPHLNLRVSQFGWTSCLDHRRCVCQYDYTWILAVV